ncbi:2-octaprenyl-6-methoxyphenyl hydroxylase [Candidatus Venteria ishoeyi]|uniref:2-octaprenyl-6-methoxyphenyl hydroxylase n=1 Tax=Candidatus Venteria ishoeyi TaxID=1899563 RepID=UPI0025A56BE2|nr:2-octaprenyl-6-methoxyphenyl hydroxylase [Candidatus Venteria ishoeyi]MDM8547232.1 2-octaprenyl-6-methoxyphenyl hydroxylase [Candidatus Venteria ishoeyi]
MSDKHYDITIVGGGLIGISLACALRGSGLSIALIEAGNLSKDKATQAPDHYDDRVIALAYGSRLIYEKMGLWSALEPASTAIKDIHISDRGHFSFCRLHSHEVGVAALGYVIAARAIGVGLLPAVNADIYSPAQAGKLQIQPDYVELPVINRENAEKHTIQTRLLVAADGGQSAIARQLNIDMDSYEYGQTAVIANVTLGLPHHNQAYERFTNTGPMALLPRNEQEAALVWTVGSEQAKPLLDLSEREFLAILQQRFGWRQGKFLQVGQRSAFPLVRSQARESFRQRVVVIGNAAHSMHPAAGQGLNLGLRDVAALAQLLQQAQKNATDVGANSLLKAYDRARSRDQDHIMSLTDALVRVFSNEQPLLTVGRNLGLLALSHLPPLKRLFIRHTAGLMGSGLR